MQRASHLEGVISAGSLGTAWDLFPLQLRPSVEVCTSASGHGDIGTDEQSLTGRCPFLPSSLTHSWIFTLGFCHAWRREIFTGPRIILNVMEGPELLIPEEGAFCWEKPSSEPSDLRVLTNPCSLSLLQAVDRLPGQPGLYSGSLKSLVGS